MSLIIFMLLVVVVLAVGVRVLEAGSKVGLALAILVAVVLGFRLVSQQMTVGQMVTINSVVADDRAVESSAQPSNVEGSEEVGEVNAPPEVSTTVTDADEPAVLDEEKDAETDATPASLACEADDLEIEVVATPGNPIIPPRPDWVAAKPIDEDESPIDEDESRIVVVASGPQGHLGECPSALDAELERAVNEYIDEYLGQVYGDKFQASTLVSFPAEYIRDELVADGKIYEERIQFSFGPMYQSHAQVAFTPAFRSVLDGERVSLDKQWEQIVVAGRLTGAAIVFGLILALLAVVCGYFRLDTATRGFYTARLQFLATVAILAVIVAGVLLARNVHWM